MKINSINEQNYNNNFKALHVLPMEDPFNVLSKKELNQLKKVAKEMQLLTKNYKDSVITIDAERIQIYPNESVSEYLKNPESQNSLALDFDKNTIPELLKEPVTQIVNKLIKLFKISEKEHTNRPSLLNFIRKPLDEKEQVSYNEFGIVDQINTVLDQAFVFKCKKSKDKLLNKVYDCLYFKPDNFEKLVKYED